MGLLDDLMAQSGGIADIIKKNPQLVAAAVSMLSTKQGSVGGTGGLDGLVSTFQRGGMGDVMSSWIGTGDNQQISPGQLSDVLGPDTMSQFGKAAGVSGADATLGALEPPPRARQRPHSPRAGAAGRFARGNARRADEGPRPIGLAEAFAPAAPGRAPEFG